MDTDEASWISLSSGDGQDDDTTYDTPITSPDVSPLRQSKQQDLLSTLGEQQDKLDEASVALIVDTAEVKDILRSLQMSFTPRKQRPSRLPRATPVTPLRPRKAAKHGIDFPNRFISARKDTPTKERLLLSNRTTARGLKTVSEQDPFSSPSRSTIAANQFFTVTRHPAPELRSHSLSGTSVGPRAAVLLGDAFRWTVAGHPVTEGVASTPNGRGGRVVSSTNAPLFNASMLAQARRPPEITTFSRRLAIAMDVDLAAKMISTSTGSSPIDENNASSVQRTVWQDGRWLSGTSVAPSSRPQRKTVPPIPFKILAAPDLRNDYYCSLLAYCPTLNCIAVGLSTNVHLWADLQTRQQVTILDAMLFHRENAHITSISFSSKAGKKSILAVGRADGGLALWTPSEEGPRLSCNQARPISHVCFRPCPSRRPSERDQNIIIDSEELLVGTDDGSVMLYSIEWPDRDLWNLFDWPRSMTLRSKIMCNTQQICGIAWSGDGKTFATGGNDNQLFVFDFVGVQQVDDTRVLEQPRREEERRYTGGADHSLVKPGQEKSLFTLNAAVKAIAFAPWQSTLLAASGGSNDRCIHFLHTTSGARLATINCHAQVTSLAWNRRRKEIVATLGFAQPDHPYRIVTFAWPSCEQLTCIPWPNEERALYAISYPSSGLSGASSKKDDCLVVATSDHSIKFHEIWHERKNSSSNATGYAKSQILNDTCSEELENELAIR